LKNTEKITAQLAGNQDISATLHNLRSTSAELNTTVSDLGVQFKKVGQNLTEASDTVKRQPWRLIWPSTKKYDEEARPAPAGSRSPAPTSQKPAAKAKATSKRETKPHAVRATTLPD